MPLSAISKQNIRTSNVPLGIMTHGSSNAHPMDNICAASNTGTRWMARSSVSLLQIFFTGLGRSTYLLRRGLQNQRHSESPAHNPEQTISKIKKYISPPRD